VGHSLVAKFIFATNQSRLNSATILCDHTGVNRNGPIGRLFDNRKGTNDMGKTLSYNHSKLINSKGWSLDWVGTDEAFNSTMAALAKGFGVEANVPEYLLQNGFSQAMQDSIAGKVLTDGGNLGEYLDAKFTKIKTGDLHSRGQRVDEVTKFAREFLVKKLKGLDKDASAKLVAQFVEKNRDKIEMELASRKARLETFELSDADVTPKKKKA
jgi:hypothetical protein